MPVVLDLNMSEELYTRLRDRYRGQIDIDILRQYKEPDEYVVLNEDKHLHPIHIKLPQPTEWNTIDGWGLKQEDQKFTYQIFPKKLQKLIDVCESIDEIWDELESNQNEYHKEIEWIKLQWKRYENGYWFFCNGKPTYLVGWHYIYLNFWRFKGGKKPDYRDRNRKFYHGMRYAYTTTETIAYTKEGRIIYVDELRRIPKMIDTKQRTFLGISYPKNRKDGASNMCLCAEYMEVITHKGVIGGIISMTGDHAKEKMFDEIMVPGWSQMPFFFKPRTTSNQNPDKEIKFNASRSRADRLKQPELDCKISYSTTSTSKLYDGGNNIWINCDEAGKSEIDVFERHRQLKPCVSFGNGANIFGFLTYPSTVGEMAGSGGAQFFKICKDSQFEKRDISGQTKSGMFVIYFSSVECLDGFVGPYGESVINTPTPEQKKFIGKNYGALAHLNSKREQLLADEDVEGYNEEVRLFPLNYMECFRTEDGEIGFNTKIINDRLDELTFMWKEKVRRGNFSRVKKDDKYSRVIWEDHDEGRWFLSEILNEDMTNKQFSKTLDGVLQRFPVDSKYTASADAYKFEKVQGSRMSDGGGGVFKDFDPAIDGNVDMRYWQTHRVVCTYLNRPTKKDDYCEDMVMMCQYFGAYMYPEIEIPDVWDYFRDHGYEGYLKFDLDMKTRKLKNTPGFNSKGSKQALFSAIRDYIQDHGHREVHRDFLMQCKDISAIEEMTDYDLITTIGGCLLGTRGNLGKMVPFIPEKPASVQTFYPKRIYR